MFQTYFSIVSLSNHRIDSLTEQGQRSNDTNGTTVYEIFSCIFSLFSCGCCSWLLDVKSTQECEVFEKYAIKIRKKTTTKTSSLAEASGKGGVKGGDDGRRWRSYLSGWLWEGLHTMSHDGSGPKSANTKRLQRCSCIHDFWLRLL